MKNQFDNRKYDSPVHAAFGLSYCSYFTVPRIALQSMSIEWQRQFMTLIEQLPDTPEYTVQRKDARGRFTNDPWRDYRHGNIEELTKENQCL